MENFRDEVAEKVAGRSFYLVRITYESDLLSRVGRVELFRVRAVGWGSTDQHATLRMHVHILNGRHGTVEEVVKLAARQVQLACSQLYKGGAVIPLKSD